MRRVLSFAALAVAMILAIKLVCERAPHLCQCKALSDATFRPRQVP